MKPRIIIPVVAVLALGVLTGVILYRMQSEPLALREQATAHATGETMWEPEAGLPDSVGESRAPLGRPRPENPDLQHPARPNEAVFIFKDEAAYREFLNRVDDYGLRVISGISHLRAVRLGVENREGLERALADLGNHIVTEPNLLVGYPSIPASGAAASGFEEPFKNNFLAALGLEGRALTWGSGVTVAVLDSGVEGHTTLAGQVSQVTDFYPDDSTVNGHGTAVASVIAGSHPLAPGVAPGADIRSYRVLDSSGVGDMFTVAEGIMQAIADGADVINLSLGAYGESAVVVNALNEADRAGVAVVAAVGNDGVPLLAFPASYESVISVGAVDARNQQVWFSNQGEGIDLAAPGYGLYAAYPDEKLVSISGTSFAGPMVSGMIAGVMSDNPGMTGVEAAEFIMAHTHDAGRAGADRSYGAGIPSYAMIRMAGTSGVSNAGVSGIDLSRTDQGTVLHTAVQNRGSQTLYNLAVEVQAGSHRTFHTIPRLDPGHSQGFDWKLPSSPGDFIEVNALVRSGSGDSIPEDDQVQIRLPAPGE